MSSVQQYCTSLCLRGHHHLNYKGVLQRVAREGCYVKECNCKGMVQNSRPNSITYCRLKQAKGLLCWLLHSRKQ